MSHAIDTGLAYEEAMPPEERRTGRPQVLVVDDDDDIVDALRDCLGAEGYEVTGASDGREALFYLLENPAPNLVLLDLQMPHMNGLELVKVLRSYRRFAAIPVIIMTAGRPLARAPAELLHKPLDLPKLLARLLEIAGRPQDD